MPSTAPSAKSIVVVTEAFGGLGARLCGTSDDHITPSFSSSLGVGSQFGTLVLAGSQASASGSLLCRSHGVYRGRRSILFYQALNSDSSHSLLPLQQLPGCFPFLFRSTLHDSVLKQRYMPSTAARARYCASSLLSPRITIVLASGFSFGIRLDFLRWPGSIKPNHCFHQLALPLPYRDLRASSICLVFSSPFQPTRETAETNPKPEGCFRTLLPDLL